MSDNSAIKGGQAALAIFAGMATLGYTDNFVRLIAEDAGLWQFHAVRSAMVMPLLLLAPLLGLGAFWPKKPGAVLARSLFSAGAMVVYFGCLGLLPIGIVAAGFFTSPIFILLISWMFMGRRVGPVRLFAVLLGFAGVLLVIQPDPNNLEPLAFVPMIAGLLYAIGALATRAWCEGESTVSLTAGFFGLLGIFGCIGLIYLHVYPVDVPAGRDGFILRGAVTMSSTAWLWTVVQAVGSMIGILFIFRGYAIGDASYVSIYEYSLLIFASFWAYYLWGEALNPLALIGIALIIASGVIITLRSQGDVE
jgi:drug/metabolite transporter (DMT)-like permease